MGGLSWNIFFLCTLSHSAFIQGYAESLAANVDVPSPHIEHQIAMVCEGNARYYSQHMTDTGTWVTDTSSKVFCLKNKTDILRHCQKMYPNEDIANIVESTQYYKISNWCREGHKKCKSSHRVKPYRCLKRKFQSDALLVPDSCQFDHIHNETRCWEFQRWNTTAQQACHSEGLILRSFAMLLPCGVDVFSGVEFVCCPKAYKGTKPKTIERNYPPIPPAATESDAEMIDDEEADEDPVTKDPYFSKFDPRDEHEEFREAEQRLEERHREKITQVMKDWADIEERYQELKETDMRSADAYKRKMTQRFQKTVQALEMEGEAEKHQLVGLHQQRVTAHINELKREGMTCYIKALNQNPPNTQRVQKCLEKLLRALHKDRHHTISHYRHLLNNDPVQANREKAVTSEHLTDLDRMVNESLQMLSRHPDLQRKIKQLMVDFEQALRSKYSPPTELMVQHSASLPTPPRRQTPVHVPANVFQQEEINRLEAASLKKKALKKKKKTQMEKVATKKGKVGSVVKEALYDPETMEDERTDTTARNPVRAPTTPAPKRREEDHVPHQQLVEPQVSHVKSHQFSHDEAAFSVKREVYPRESRGVYLTLAFAGIALMAAMVIGIVALRRRNARSPQQQGFVEVDQSASPEERHVANMQINGYENPTYRYFEASAN